MKLLQTSHFRCKLVWILYTNST